MFSEENEKTYNEPNFRLHFHKDYLLPIVMSSAPVNTPKKKQKNVKHKHILSRRETPYVNFKSSAENIYLGIRPGDDTQDST